MAGATAWKLLETGLCPSSVPKQSWVVDTFSLVSIQEQVASSDAGRVGTSTRSLEEGKKESFANETDWCQIFIVGLDSGRTEHVQDGAHDMGFSAFRLGISECACAVFMRVFLSVARCLKQNLLWNSSSKTWWFIRAYGSIGGQRGFIVASVSGGGFMERSGDIPHRLGGAFGTWVGALIRRCLEWVVVVPCCCGRFGVQLLLE